MFESKVNSLFATKKRVATSSVSTMESNNPFVNYGTKKASVIPSGNGSLKFSTSGSNFVDQFSSASKYKSPRPYSEVSSDMEKLWSKNPRLTVVFTFYLRMITRVIQFFNGTKTETTQRGQGLKHEGIFRMFWIFFKSPDTFWKNIGLFISVGSWKDIIVMLSYDLQYNGWKNRKLDWDKFGKLILAGLENPNTVDLVKKYLPQIKANSACKTLQSQADNIIAKWICSLLYGEKNATGSTYKRYRNLKVSGTAHQWQQLISKGKMLEINFNSIHGRALAQLVSSKFLKNQGLESKYEAWIESKPVAKFTGWVHELIMGKNYSSLTSYQRSTIDKQFNKLVEVAKNGLSNQGLRPISVLDCSGSMNSPMYIGDGKTGKLKSIEVAMSSALFFDAMMMDNSPFKNNYLTFGNKTTMHNFSPRASFTERYFTSNRSGYGGTNFQSVFDFFVDFKIQNPFINETLIPNFIVCFSDGEFNRVGSKISNVELGRVKLKMAGYSKEYCDSFGICFVDLPNNFYRTKPSTKFETFADAKNTFYFSGYDLSPLAFLFGVEGKTIEDIPTTADELFLAMMDQEVLNMIEL